MSRLGLLAFSSARLNSLTLQGNDAKNRYYVGVIDCIQTTSNKTHILVSQRNIRVYIDHIWNYSSEKDEICQVSRVPLEFLFDVLSSGGQIFYILVLLDRKISSKPFLLMLCYLMQPIAEGSR